MSKRVAFDDAEIAEHTDFGNIGEFAQEALDHVMNDAIGYPAHWAAFTVAKVSAQEVSISTGRYLAGEVVYAKDAISTLNLQLFIPVAASDQRWVALILRGEEVTEEADRPFETGPDVETSIPVERPTPKTIRRKVNVIVQAGSPNPTPSKPIVAETDACIAMVLLTATGVEVIEPGESWRAKTLYEVEGRLSTIEVDLSSLFLRTETIETQIVNIWGKLTEIPRPTIIRQMQRDIGAARLLLDLPDEARAYRFDNGLISSLADGGAWDNGHVDWLARVEEGVRFGYAATATARLELQAPDDPKVMAKGSRVVPAYDEVTRLANVARDATLNISQLVHTETTLVRKEASRIRTTYGPTMFQCENQAGWAALGSSRVGEMLTVNGETFEVVSGVAASAGAGHDLYGIRQIRVQHYTEPYWEYVTEDIGINGSVYAQTFLVAQPMQATSLDLSFARVGLDGDVHVFIVETNRSAAPRFDKVLAQGVLAHGDLVEGWNKVDLPITLLESGKRYAFVTVTTGNHALHVSTGNKFTGGSRFLTTDGAFAQGDTAEDICFRLNAARYRSPRSVVPMRALTLADGMTEIDLLFAGWVPGGTELAWEIRPAGTDQWIELDDGDPAENPLVGLPASVELRMVMIGTADLSPMIQLDALAQSRVSRNRSTMVAPSEDVAFGISSDSLVTQFTVDAFDAERHTFTPSILVAGAVVAPTSTEIILDLQRPTRRTYLSTYALGATTTSARMKPSATTDNVVTVPFIQDAFIAAL
ncbi:hypothetical protein [Aurantimonas phage AmM-1]|uniref:hypothetical protein n=1 Tax=Aurantimonas phage AmM-1 TaxID=1503929 RepID=UPI000540B6A7|nr:hypothetical protein ACQ23_gp17 [Aurantimonas phage AmM-1]BAP94474.1 hypothetical protein [Aurantimonas phage AmM-1]